MFYFFFSSNSAQNIPVLFSEIWDILYELWGVQNGDIFSQTGIQWDLLDFLVKLYIIVAELFPQNLYF